MNRNTEASNQQFNDLERAKMLRQQADFLESKERVRSRLRQLMHISQDPYYDQYLAQMLKDLEAGKATPEQVEREAQRSYAQYRQRMAQVNTGQKIQANTGQKIQANTEQKVQANTEQKVQAKTNQMVQTVNAPENVVPGQKKENAVEFKIGIHGFSMVGALFVLIAFVIFSFNFMSGLWQGICLYAAALILAVISEILLRKKAPKFSNVITGIGIGGLYIANIVNYLVLETVNGLVALFLTLLIALGTIFLSHKKDSAVIRIVSLLGCYICFFPVEGFGTELNFLVITVMLFIINTFCVFLQNQKNRVIINTVHLALNILFTAILVGMAWAEEIGAVYLIGFVIAAFAFVSFMAYRQCKADEDSTLFTFTCIGNGLNLFMLFLVGNFGPGMKEPMTALFAHLIAEVLVVVICVLTFMFWEKADRRKWAQIYYIAGGILLLGSFSEYHAEVIASILIVLLIAKVLNGKKELITLDCIAVLWTGLAGLWLSDYWYCWLLAGALLLSILRIRELHVYHEIVTVVSILVIWWSQCNYFLDDYGLEDKWLYPISIAVLIIFFLLYNHLPWLKNKNQKSYNIISIVFATLYCVAALSCKDYVISSIMMVLGTTLLLIVLRKRYDLFLSKKYLVIAGFLTIYSLLGHFPSPVAVSIILMVIALGCVGIGFKQQDKGERICGLVMAVFVCIKLVLYDFREVETIYKMIVFLVVGVLALIISFIYILLEKNIEKKQKELETDGGAQ